VLLLKFSFKFIIITLHFLTFEEKTSTDFEEFLSYCGYQNKENGKWRHLNGIFKINRLGYDNDNTNRLFRKCLLDNFNFNNLMKELNYIGECFKIIIFLFTLSKLLFLFFLFY
jgi:hypothetical protein